MKPGLPALAFLLALVTACDTNRATPASTLVPSESPLRPLEVLAPADVSSIQLLRTLPIPGLQKGSRSQCSVAFSPDGSLLSGVCYRNTIAVWDTHGGQLIHTLETTPTREVSVAFSPNGRWLATGGFANNIRLWDHASGQLIRTLGELPSPVWDVAFGPDGTRLAAANFDYNLPAAAGLAPIHLWDASTGALLWDYQGTGSVRVLSVDYAPDGRTIAFGTLDSAVVLDAESGALIKSLPIPDHVGDLAFSPDGKLLATASDDRRIRLWHTGDYSLQATLSGHEHYVNGIAFCPDGRLIISGSHDKTIGIWDLATGQPLRMLAGHQAEVLRVAVNPEGTLIASVSWDGTVRLWGVVQ